MRYRIVFHFTGVVSHNLKYRLHKISEISERPLCLRTAIQRTVFNGTTEVGKSRTLSRLNVSTLKNIAQ